MAKVTPEGKVERDIKIFLDALQDQGILYWWRRQAIVGGGYKNGLPDIYGCYGRLHFEIEVKRTDGKGVLSPRQKIWQQRFKKMKTPYCLASSVDDVKNFFAQEFGYLP